MQEKQWFKLDEVNLETSRFNNFKELKEKRRHAEKINGNSWNLSYVEVNAKLTFMGKLNTPNGEVDTEFVYYIKTTYQDMKKEAKIKIYEQTFTGLDEAVTIRFSSGSIISKIVFGDIEKCYTLLKEKVNELITEYNTNVEEFNKEIDELSKEEDESDE